MKSKFFILIVISTLSLTNTYAQEFSILGGANFSNMSSKYENVNFAKDSDYSLRPGGHLAVMMDLKFGKVFSIEPGLMFITKGFKANAAIAEVPDYRLRFNTFYLDIPILAKFNWNPKENFRIYGGVGPVIGVGLFGKLKVQGSVEQLGTQYPNLPRADRSVDFGGEVDRMDVGLMFTTGLNISKARIGVFYNQGIKSITNDMTTSRNRVFGVHVGYTIAFRNEE